MTYACHTLIIQKKSRIYNEIHMLNFLVISNSILWNNLSQKRLVPGDAPAFLLVLIRRLLQNTLQRRHDFIFTIHMEHGIHIIFAARHFQDIAGYPYMLFVIRYCKNNNELCFPVLFKAHRFFEKSERNVQRIYPRLRLCMGKYRIFVYKHVSSESMKILYDFLQIIRGDTPVLHQTLSG